MSSTNSVSIPESRIQQVNELAHKYISDFCKKSVPGVNADDFMSSFDPNVEWYDHAFHIRRVGHTAVLGLKESFLYCNQPFDVKIKAIIPTSEGAVVEQVWNGRQVNDIVRPDGAVVVKASGKTFNCHVCMILKISEDGLITRIDEYYNKSWDDGIPEEEYMVMKGSSLKAKG